MTLTLKVRTAKLRRSAIRPPVAALAQAAGGMRIASATVIAFTEEGEEFENVNHGVVNDRIDGWWSQQFHPGFEDTSLGQTP